MKNSGASLIVSYEKTEERRPSAGLSAMRKQKTEDRQLGLSAIRNQKREMKREDHPLDRAHN